LTALQFANNVVESRELIFTRKYDAPRDLVFEVWSEAKHIVNWWGPKDFTLAHCEIDFRVGGRYRFCMRSPDGEDFWVSGEYREIDEPALISFTWVREDHAGRVWCSNVVTVTFEDDWGRTDFCLRQKPFDEIAHRDQHQGGWTQCLDRLGEYVEVR
jgi:uncharacterized protein YndB with AHSA1/START domain